jgi:hypothetical protein
MRVKLNHVMAHIYMTNGKLKASKVHPDDPEHVYRRYIGIERDISVGRVRSTMTLAMWLPVAAVVEIAASVVVVILLTVLVA